MRKRSGILRMSARRHYTRGIFAAGAINGKFSALAIFWILNRAKILNAQNILKYDTDKKRAQAGGSNTRRHRVHVRTMRTRRVQYGKHRLHRRAVHDLLRTRRARLFKTRAAIRYIQKLQRVPTLPTRTKKGGDIMTCAICKHFHDCNIMNQTGTQDKTNCGWVKFYDNAPGRTQPRENL